jgi:hypothetical protein
VLVVAVDLTIEGKTNTRTKTNVIEEHRIEEGCLFPLATRSLALPGIQHQQ